jgi:GMP reductase
VPYRGQVENTIPDILGCIRIPCTYVGASQLKEVTKRRTFISVSEQEILIYENNGYV